MEDKRTTGVTKLIALAADVARKETSNEPEPTTAADMSWPVTCTVGPGLEGAIACESKIGYVNGAKGWLIYRGYDIFDLCAHSTYEEVRLPAAARGTTDRGRARSSSRANSPATGTCPRRCASSWDFPVEDMNTMAALRLGTLFMRAEADLLRLGLARARTCPETPSDRTRTPSPWKPTPTGKQHAIYEFQRSEGVAARRPPKSRAGRADRGVPTTSSPGVSTITAAIARSAGGKLPIEPRSRPEPRGQPALHDDRAACPPLEESGHGRLR